MTRQEYDKLRLDLIEKNAIELNELAKKYCLSNNPYKIGDVFTDHNGSIRIDKIKFSPIQLCCVYEGVVLKKDLTPGKRGKIRRAWQFHEIKKL